MRAYYPEYGWRRVPLGTWLRWLLFCLAFGHRQFFLGDPCPCGSDNCLKCPGCGYHMHD